jgi:hypothetical protein
MVQFSKRKIFWLVVFSFFATNYARATTAIFTYIGPSLQTFTAPFTGVYNIMAYGAAGGAGYNGDGGLGARIGGSVTLNAGTTLSILVGGNGGSGASGDCATDGRNCNSTTV